VIRTPKAWNQIRADLVAGVGGDGETPGPAGLGRGRRGQGGAQQHGDAEFAELTVQLGAYFGKEAGQEAFGLADDGHALVRPDLFDLSRQFQPDRAGAEDQDTAGAGQLLVRRAEIIERLGDGRGGWLRLGGVERSSSVNETASCSIRRDPSA
jgi:hypothetical protein